MHPTGAKVVHLLTGDYGFIVDIPVRWKTDDTLKDSWVLWMSGKDTFGKVLWEDPKMLYPIGLER